MPGRHQATMQQNTIPLFKKKIFVLPSVSLIEFELIDGECVCCTILLALFDEFCEWAEVVDEPHSIMSFSLFYEWERNCGSSQKLLTAAKVGCLYQRLKAANGFLPEP